LREEKTQIILSNTYHLMLQPGADLVAKMGGLHRFMGWDGPMLTDSGGFQIFSLGHGSVADEIKGRRDIARPKTLLKISEKGAAFRSYIDGSKHLLTPEGSIDIQRKLGADLIVTFDECTPYHSDRKYTERSLHLSNRWADRCLAEFDRGAKGTQALYGILQGGVYRDLRHEAAAYVNDRPFFGNAVGGTLGANSAQMDEVVSYAMETLNRTRPTHLLGIGGFRDIFAGVAQGIDTFDCVSPTRIARHGAALMPGVKGERVNLKNARFKDDAAPVDETCDCYCCRNFSRAYVHHLIKAEELLGMQLLTQHNINVMNRLMREVQAAIPEGRLDDLRKRWVAD
ncbi:MAG TPA: tRNA guanosine(34) transglycosylase Tgt, partial [Dongiaceae bacterium]|nr:tRNA guanosine(34) transglycosylase Tgt [Dongiaceae bacterium]